jgi:hypothetical protein
MFSGVNTEPSLVNVNSSCSSGPTRSGFFPPGSAARPFDLDHIVLEARGLGEKEDFLGSIARLCGQARRQRQPPHGRNKTYWPNIFM